VISLATFDSRPQGNGRLLPIALISPEFLLSPRLTHHFAQSLFLQDMLVQRLRRLKYNL
jgi:hypothetical protein